MSLLAEIFTWWNGQTLGTRVWTRLYGQKVGDDDQGNVYYQSADGTRRWVIYNGEAEASRIPPEWHGWLHRTWEEPPSAAPIGRKPWEKDHLPNLTGTPAAYHPPGSVLTPERRARVGSDYEAWTPE